MKPINLYTEPFHILDIIDCAIDKKVNEHFTAKVVGRVCPDADEDSYINTLLQNTFAVKATTEEEDILLFQGNVSHIEIIQEDGVTRIMVEAESKTAVLDKKVHTRSYQGEKQTYRNLIDHVLSFHKHTAMIQSKGEGVRTRGLVVQYEETDWQFLKRLASQLNTVLVPDCTNDHICFYFGSPERRGNDHLDLEEYQMRRYYDYKQRECVEYIQESRKVRNLCERVYVKGQTCYVHRIEGRMKGQEMVFRYGYRPTKGFEVAETVNREITGCSLMGEVQDIQDTHVRVRIFTESDQNFGSPIWFPFSTVYSSPDGTGWYCMPEKGDRIRLCIPSHKEEEGYVISAVHLENEHGLRKNPDEKSIRTKFHKEIRITPDKILITNHKGNSITMDDKKGIIIKSNRKINIISEREIEMKGEQIQAERKSGVFLMEGPNTLMVRDGIKEQGVNIEHR